MRYPFQKESRVSTTAVTKEAEIKAEPEIKKAEEKNQEPSSGSPKEATNTTTPRAVSGSAAGGSPTKGKKKRKGKKLGRKGKGKGSSGPPDCILVEDVPVSRRIAEVALKRVKYRVVGVGTGEDAVNAFRQHHTTLKLILMDINLGVDVMDGVEATKIIRGWEQSMNLKKVIIFGLTGNFGKEELAVYEDAGMNGCIGKGEMIVKALKRALELYQENPSKFVTVTSLTHEEE